MRLRFLRLLAASLAVAALPLFLAQADEPIPQLRLTPSDIDAMAQAGAAGPRMTTLLGDPARPGLYSVRVSIPAHTQIPPHTHRDNRAVTVLSGIWHMGYGTSFDTKALKDLPPGSFFTEPAGQPHFSQTEGEPVVILVTGLGPSDTKFVAPSR
jgi:quercetin dioxygenase-like cupin family protein